MGNRISLSILCRQSKCTLKSADCPSGSIRKDEDHEKILGLFPRRSTLNTVVLAACAERKRNDEDALWRKEIVLSMEGIIKDCCMGSNDSLVSPTIWRRKGLGEAEERPRDQG